MKNQLLLADFASRPWALTPDYLQLASQVMVQWAINAPVASETREQIEHDKNARAQRASASQQAGSGSIYVIPVYGIISQRPVENISGNGGTSSARLAQEITQASNDPSIKEIILEFDGPGGDVYGTLEAGNAIYAARQKKLVIGISNSMAASATLWLATQCTEFYCTPSGEVGSIGVYTAHKYVGKALQDAGIEMTLISAGDYKTESNPFEPLNDDAKAAIQKRIDDYYGMFISAVARGRGVNEAKVQTDFGKGRMLGANDALAVGLIDGIMSFDELISARLANQKPNNTMQRNHSAMRSIALIQ